MTSADTRVNDLVVNVMTEEQFEKITPQDNQLYLTPDEDYPEWKKPSDWMDLRSGASDNSIYFLVGHSGPVLSEGTYTVSKYNKFTVFAEVTGNVSYDVYVDGLKVATTAQNSYTTLNWAALYTSGLVSTVHTTTHPESLVQHIVRITPSDRSKSFVTVRATPSAFESSQGLLWAHFCIGTTAIYLNNFAGNNGDSDPMNPICEAITSREGCLYVKGLAYAFFKMAALQSVPVLDGSSVSSVACNSMVRGTNNLRTISFRNLTGVAGGIFQGASKLEHIYAENSMFYGLEMCNNCSSLKEIPPIKSDTLTSTSSMFGGCVSLGDTHFDLSDAKLMTIFTLGGSVALPGIKSVVVSPEAPFNSSTSPQISVRYAGMNKEALVNLFKSMPYNVGYMLVGSPTITDGIAGNFSGTDYVKTSQVLETGQQDTFEFKTKFVKTASASLPLFFNTGRFVCSGATGQPPYIALRNYGENQGSYGSRWTAFKGTATQGFNTNTPYWVKMGHDGSYIYLDVSTDGTNYTNWISVPTKISSGAAADWVAPTVTGSPQTALGFAPTDYYLHGTMDLNETSITKNGALWFRGTATAMTKTCDVRNCTGTADLTAADKAIAEDKFWSLIVA